MSDDNYEGMEIDGYTEEEIEKVLNSGNPELIEKMLAGEKVVLGEEEPAKNASNQTDVDTSEGATAKQDEDGATSGATVEGEKADAAKANTQEEGEKHFIESKQGGHKIPYGVLENTRKERDQALEQLNQAQKRLSELESSSTKLQSSLEKAGIDLSTLEQGEKLTDEQLKTLEELDPAIAQLARITIGLFERVENVQTRIETKAETNTDPNAAANAAIVANKDLASWMEGDPDRWETAVFYDSQLRNLPAFKNKSLDERFAEAVRLTKEAFGDPVEEINSRENAADVAAKKVAEAKGSAIPRSLTDLGASPQTERSQIEVLGDLSDSDINEKLAKMTPEQIDRLLAQAG